MENFTVEELKTAVGGLMLDLRCNWGFDYVERMEEVELLLEYLIDADKENMKDYKSDLSTTRCEILEPEDGRVFRDSCFLYGYSSDEGKTQRVRDYLLEIMTYPEYSLFDLQ